jgi:hypothetical protein
LCKDRIAEGASSIGLDFEALDEEALMEMIVV